MKSIRSSLSEALDLRSREWISLVGAGGKTSLMFILARELASRRFKVITTTTTKIFPPSAEESPALILGEEKAPEALERALEAHGQATWARERTRAGKLAGLSPDSLSRFWSRNKVDYLLVEADGSARRPVKAPGPHEPVVPPETTLLVSILGLSALGKPLNEDFCFRPEIAGSLMGLERNQPMDPEAVARLLVHPRGGLKGRRPGMRTAVFLNQADTSRTFQSAVRISERVMERGRGEIERVIVGQLKPPGSKKTAPKIFSIRL